jgi:Rad3-related DNA helicase
MVDKILSHYKDKKGIIHCTSYSQLKFIRDGLSADNRRRLLETDPEKERDDVIAEHRETPRPTVLIFPSLHLGLSLDDDLSRFQILVKIPYPYLADKWITAKYNRPGGKKWYTWQTALKVVQMY